MKNVSWRNKLGGKVLPWLVAIGIVTTGGVLYSDIAEGHGYIQQPASRAVLGGANNVGAVQYEPQSLEAPKGFPEGGPADGKIASAGGLFGGVLDEQTSTRWIKHEMTGGINEFTWYKTAAHKTSKWHYYITTKTWNPNAPLKRSDLEHIATIQHDGSNPAQTVTHRVNIPTDRSGYHVILAVWDIADTANAFYNVIDVNLKNGSVVVPPDTVAPSAPTNLHVMNTASNEVNVMWMQASDNTGVSHYVVYRADNNGTARQIGTSDTTSFKDTSVQPGSKYSYYVVAVDRAGNASQSSNVIHVNTPAVEQPNPTDPDTVKPSVVTGLHTMSVTHGSVDVMWNAGYDNVGVKHYVVYRNGVELGIAAGTSYLDTTVQPQATYQYTVVAVDAAGNRSNPSTTLSVTTPAKPELPSVPEWNAYSTYTVGTRVQYKGVVYQARVTYTGHGDPSWNPESALSLWLPVK